MSCNLHNDVSSKPDTIMGLELQMIKSLYYTVYEFNYVQKNTMNMSHWDVRRILTLKLRNRVGYKSQLDF